MYKAGDGRSSVVWGLRGRREVDLGLGWGRKWVDPTRKGVQGSEVA